MKATYTKNTYTFHLTILAIVDVINLLMTGVYYEIAFI